MPTPGTYERKPSYRRKKYKTKKKRITGTQTTAAIRKRRK